MPASRRDGVLVHGRQRKEHGWAPGVRAHRVEAVGVHGEAREHEYDGVMAAGAPVTFELEDAESKGEHGRARENRELTGIA